jgi:hypothetical protein
MKRRPDPLAGLPAHGQAHELIVDQRPQPAGELRDLPGGCEEPGLTVDDQGRGAAVAPRHHGQPVRLRLEDGNGAGFLV